MIEDEKSDIEEIKIDVKLIKRVLMGEGDSNPHGGLIGKVISIDTKQKIILAILGAVGIASLGLIFSVGERLLLVIFP